LQCTKKTGHKITTQEEHPIYHYLTATLFLYRKSQITIKIWN